MNTQYENRYHFAPMTKAGYNAKLNAVNKAGEWELEQARECAKGIQNMERRLNTEEYLYSLRVAGITHQNELPPDGPFIPSYDMVSSIRHDQNLKKHYEETAPRLKYWTQKHYENRYAPSVNMLIAFGKELRSISGIPIPTSIKDIVQFERKLDREESEDFASEQSQIGENYDRHVMLTERQIKRDVLRAFETGVLSPLLDNTIKRKCIKEGRDDVYRQSEVPLTQSINPNEFMKRFTIEQFKYNLSARSLIALGNAGIKTLGEITDMPRSDIEALPNMDKKVADDIASALGEFGLTYAKEESVKKEEVQLVLF